MSASAALAARDAALLQEVSRAVLRSAHVEAIGREVVSLVAAACGFDVGLIRLLDPERSVLVPVGSYGVHDDVFMREHRVELQDPAIMDTLGRVIELRETRIVPDVAAAPGMATFKHEAVRSAVLVSVASDDQVLGTLSFGSRSPRTFDVAQVKLLETIGGLVGLAVQKIRLHEEAERLGEQAVRRVEELDVLFSITQTVLTAPDLQTAVERVLDTAMTVAGMELGSIRMLSASGESLVDLVVRGYQDPSFIGERGRDLKRNPMRSVTAAVSANRATLFNDIQERTGMRHFKQEGVVAAVVAPLRAGDEIIGVMYLASRENRDISEPRLHLLDAIGSQAGVAIQKSTLHQELLDAYGELKRTEARIAYLADHDSLTDLVNRRRLEEELNRAMPGGDAASAQGALLYVDLNDFKEINDSFGHAAGDVVLRSIAALLLAQTREGDTVARMGGDEFILLMPEAGPMQAEAAASRIMAALDAHSVSYEGHELRVTCCIGIALFPEHGDAPESLLVSADRALYGAKRLGRGRWQVYQPSSRDALLNGRAFGSYEVRRALAEGHLAFDAQPILDLRKDLVTRYELLLRLRDVEHGSGSSADFLNAVERFGLSQELDRWVVRRAIDLLMTRDAELGRSALEVNLSGRALADPELLPLITRLIEDTGIDPARLIFEITESEAVPDLDQARSFMGSLRAIGCRFALDDFGVGFSSFNHLRRLPVDYLKIDGSFVVDLLSDPVDRQLVLAMVGAARALGIETVAESVEDAATLALLRNLGVDYAQGYYVGEPRPVGEPGERSRLPAAR